MDINTDVSGVIYPLLLNYGLPISYRYSYHPAGLEHSSV